MASHWNDAFSSSATIASACAAFPLATSSFSSAFLLVMSPMRHTVGKKLAGKPDKTAEEQDMLDLLQNGGSRVNEENLRPVLEWCKNAGAQTQD